MIRVFYEGGPRCGATHNLPFDPKTITCHAERKALGLSNGHYRTEPVADGLYRAKWHRLEPCAYFRAISRQARRAAERRVFG